MRTFRGLVAALGLVAFVSFLAQPAADAAQSGQAPPAQTQKAEVAKGELKSVDAAKRTLTITSGQTDQVFQYDEDTKVTGAQGGVAGLATMSGRQVTVQFMTKGPDRIATAIDIAAK